jgi:hypothetical protein
VRVGILLTGLTSHIFVLCSWLIDIKSAISISYDFFVQREMVFNQESLPSYKCRDFDFSSMKLKLFDTLIRPIVTYGSEVWISDFTIKELKRDNLSFEKIHNRFYKYLLGVHKKASNFASKGWILNSS